MQQVTYLIYYTEDGECKSVPETDIGKALKICEALRARRRDGENISHITMVSENDNLVGQQGVDTIVDGKTPDGVIYDWSKMHRAGRFKTADQFKKHVKADDQT